MQVSGPWQHVTHSQLKQVPPPREEALGWLEQTDSFTAGGAAAQARSKAWESGNRWHAGLFHAAFCGMASGAVASLAAFSGHTGLATAAVCAGAIGAAVAVGLALPARGRRAEWERFERNVEPWATRAAAQLTRPGSEPGTVENHNFLEAGAFKSVYDVRNEAGSVLSRHVELANGIKLHEDVPNRTVTAETAQGTKTLPGTSLALPKCARSQSDLPHMLPTLAIRSDHKTEQSVDIHGHSDFSAGQSHPVQVFPQTLIHEGGPPGLELPDGTLRFDKWEHVLYANPPLSGRDFAQDFPVYEKPTVAGRPSWGAEVLTAAANTPPPPGGWKLEAAQAHVAGRVLNLKDLRLQDDAATGEVSLLRGDEVLLKRKGTIDIDKGTVTTPEATQNMLTWPTVTLHIDGVEVTIDAEDNVTSTGRTPARLIEGRWVDVGFRKVEIPFPRSARTGASGLGQLGD